MQNYINMQQTEYDELQAKLIKIHEDIIREESEIRSSILELVSNSGEFYVENISAKVSALLFQMGTTMNINVSILFDKSQRVCEL